MEPDRCVIIGCDIATSTYVGSAAMSGEETQALYYVIHLLHFRRDASRSPPRGGVGHLATCFTLEDLDL